MGLQHLVHLVRGDGIETAAKAGELHQLQTGETSHKGGGTVEAVVVGPLVHNAEGTLHAAQMGH